MSFIFPPKVNSMLHLSGSILALSGLFFVGQRLWLYSDEIDFGSFDFPTYISLFFLAVLYGSANIFLALAWKNLLAFSGENISYPNAIKIYGISQLAKYVPGNIFQFAGRQAMGMAQGLSARSLIKSSALELALISLVGFLFCSLLASYFIESIAVSLSALAFLSILVAVSLFARSLFSAQISSSLWHHALFLAVSGTIFLLVLTLVSSTSISIYNYGLIIGAFVISWLIGLVTPGAPAGVGVREAALLFLLGHFIAPDDLVMAVLLSRIVTVFGDILFFSVASFIKKA